MLETFHAALARADGQPDTAMAALCQLAQSAVGAKLFTVTTVDQKEGVARRLYSSMPDAYPVSGTKPLVDDDWSRHVIGQGKIFVGNSAGDLAAVFSDHELIESLGCQSVINVPIVVDGEILGTINCLDVAGHYTPERVAAAEILKLPGAACLMLHRMATRGEN
jgi:GAF domain-containing protein